MEGIRVNARNKTMFTALSDELICEIFTRLPIDSVFRCRSVCKEWCHLIDGESFVKFYTQIHPHDSRSDTLVVHEFKGDCLYSLSLDALTQSTDGTEIDVTQIKKLIKRGVVPPVSRLRAATCNGLILITTYKPDVILNPLTWEIHKLPAHDLLLLVGGSFQFSKHQRMATSGFGYDHTTDDYKVVIVYELQGGEEIVRQTLVYSLKSGIWRKTPKDYTGNVSLQKSHVTDRAGVHLDGRLYFETKTLNAIVVFNLATEDYSPLLIHMPINDQPRLLLDYFQYTYALAGHLIFTEYSHQLRRQKVWVMRDDNGVEMEEGSSPWMELFEISGDVSTGWGLHLVAYMESKSLFFLQRRHDAALLCVDIVNKSVKMIKADGLSHITAHQFSLGTIFRLGHSNGSCVNTMPTTLERLRVSIRQEECSYKIGA